MNGKLKRDRRQKRQKRPRAFSALAVASFRPATNTAAIAATSRRQG
jgi:hypothetical protein